MAQNHEVVRVQMHNQETHTHHTAPRSSHLDVHSHCSSEPKIIENKCSRLGLPVPGITICSVPEDYLFVRNDVYHAKRTCLTFPIT